MRAMNPDVPVQPIDVPILATATIVEQHIHHLIDSFEMSGARIYGVTIDDVERVIRFEDAPDDVVVDDGSATGSLAEAIHAYWYDPPVTQEA
jgi:hypothetical protein